MSDDNFLRVTYDGHLQIIEFDNPQKKNALTIDVSFSLFMTPVMLSPF